MKQERDGLYANGLKQRMRKKDGEAWGAELHMYYVRKRIVAQGDFWKFGMDAFGAGGAVYGKQPCT